MYIKRKLDFYRLFLYLGLFMAALCLYFVGDNGEPFSLILFFAMAGTDLPLFPSAVIGVLPSLFSLDILLILLYLGQAVLIAAGYFIERKLPNGAWKRSKFFPALFLTLALLLFVLLAPFRCYYLPFLGDLANQPTSQKVLFSAFLFLLSAIFRVALKTLLKKVLKCKPRTDEGAFTAVFLLLVGVGACRFFSVNAYLGIAIFILLLFGYCTKDALVLLCAFLLSLPPFLIGGVGIALFFLYGVAIALFSKSGRLATSCALLTVFFAHGYFEGLYGFPTSQLIASLLSVLLPVLFFILLPAPLLKSMENRILFYRERHLTRIAINRNRAAVGEKLFEISAVFREIQTAFSSLGDKEADSMAKRFIRNQVIEETCKNCPAYEACSQKELLPSFDALVDIGCQKGKANLIDIPRRLAETCVNHSEILYSLNKQLIEYKRYVADAENTASGRSLLAGQAQGVSEILKNLALEQSEPLPVHTARERALANALLNVGIVSNEILIYGDEENITLSLVSYGKADVKKIAAVASHLFQTPMMISQRFTLSHDKFCCILRKKPYFDAAFGVASMRKSGESASGDTHSVIKIDERKFLVTLADGMGSGEYAKQISESTVSLLESFYRAKMPSDLILTTVNKLLTFHKEESFACVDVATIDLDNGRADVVKIGSPLAFILSDNTVKVLESATLPLGILDCLRPETASYELQENDVLLFLSDGVSDAFGSPADLYEILRTLPIRNPQELVDLLVEKALQAYGNVAKDDMTALAVRLFKNTE
ncbi:MAG: SpoIIE family protein phosphatase [Clostridia bacterium]|nr:SpoIIE family protein phosphatase [Clostridia bacterium]